MRSYSASELGSCTRAQIARQLGMAPLPPPEKLQDIFDRGVAHEAECLAAMEADGWGISQHLKGFVTEDKYGTDQVLVELEVAGAKVRGRLDGVIVGLLVDGHDPAVLEIKAPFSWSKFERAYKTSDYSDPLMAQYAWQISAYMAATGLEAVVACVEYGQVCTFGIEVAPHSYDEIVERVAAMEMYVISGQVPDDCSTAQVWGCPFAYLHDRPEVVEDEVLDTYFTDYAEMKRLKDYYESEMKQTRDLIDAHLGLSDTLTTASGTATRVSPSTVTDWKKTAEALAERAGLPLEPVTKSRAGYINVTPKASE